MVEEPDGRLLIVGDYWDNVHPFMSMIRLFANGSIDPSWAPPPYNGSFGSVVKYNGGYILNYYFSSGLVKTDNYGTEDTVWYYNTHFVNSCQGNYTIPYLFNDDRLLAGRISCNADSTPELRRRFVRLLPNGIIDTSFHHNTNGPVNRIFKYDSSRLLVTGFYYMTLYDSLPVSFICRIDTSGNLDTTFHSIIPYTPIGGWSIQDAYAQPDGKIVIGGAFTIQNYPDTLGLIRLNSDGSLDSTFNNFNSVTNHNFNYDYVQTICPTTDGGYLIGGPFTTYQGQYRGRIAKTDADGFLDTTYFTGLGFEGDLVGTGAATIIYKIKKSIIADKYYAMGYFTSFNGQASQPIIRLNGLSITGEEEFGNDKIMFDVYPNPSNTSATLIFSSLPKGKTTLQVFDVSGRILYEEKITGSKTILNTSAFANGVYCCRVISDRKNFSAAARLVVVH